jgi:hypothetical protein
MGHQNWASADVSAFKKQLTNTRSVDEERLSLRPKLRSWPERTTYSVDGVDMDHDVALTLHTLFSSDFSASY